MKCRPASPVNPRKLADQHGFRDREGRVADAAKRCRQQELENDEKKDGPVTKKAKVLEEEKS